jgi:hypothetical protein
LNSHLLVKNELNALFTFFEERMGRREWEGGGRTKKKGTHVSSSQNKYKNLGE